MVNRFFDQPILNSPYEIPGKHWELDSDGQPTQRIIDKRRVADFITPIPKPKKRAQQKDLKKPGAVRLFIIVVVTDILQQEKALKEKDI